MEQKPVTCIKKRIPDIPEKGPKNYDLQKGERGDLFVAIPQANNRV